jgi:hypothetical protein
MMRLRDGLTRCIGDPNTAIYNDGSIGSGNNDVPPDTELITNGDFSNGYNGWTAYGNNDYRVEGGVLYFTRRTTGTDWASNYQRLNYSVPPNSGFEITLQAGNTSSVNKALTVALRDANSWTGAIQCDFTLSANSPLSDLTIRGKAPTWWYGMVFEIASGQADGLSAITIDNVSAKHKTSITPSTTECRTVGVPPIFLSTSSATFIRRQAGSFTVSAIGSPTPTYSLQGAPAWLSINSTTGLVTGTPPSLGVFNFTVQATNTAGTTNQAFTLNSVRPLVNKPQLYWATTQANVPMDEEIHRYPFYLNGTYSLMLDIQPTSSPGARLNVELRKSDGTFITSARASIDGRAILEAPNVPLGNYYFDVIGDAERTGTYNITLYNNTIPRLAYAWGWQSSYSNIRRWYAYLDSSQTFYIQVLRTEAPLEYTWELRRRAGNVLLQSGTSINGNAVGTGTAGPGEVDFYINPIGGTSGSYKIRIVAGSPTAPSITSANNSTFNQGTPVSFTVTASANPNNIVYSLAGAPSWLTINSSTGVMSGTPTAVGSFNFQVRASNGYVPDAVQNYTLTIAPNLPPPPTQVAPTGFTPGSLTPTYRFNAVTGAIQYQIAVYNLSTSALVFASTVPTSACGAGVCNFTPANTLANNGLYTWYAITQNSAGWGNWSSGMNFWVSVPPAAPELISPSGGFVPSPATLQPQYRWKPVAGGVQYAIAVYDLYSGNLAFFQAFDVIANPSLCSATQCMVTPTGTGTTLVNGRRYGWFVAGVSYAAPGPWSTGMAFDIYVTPAQPTLISPSGATTNTPTYRWNRAVGATEYYVLVMNAAGGIASGSGWVTAAAAGCPMSGVSTQCQFTQPVSLPSGQYTWYIAASNPAGISVYSAGLTITVPPSSPQATPVGAPTFVPPSR